MEITRTTLGIAVGIAGSLFLGYCVYFDQQRRKDPLFKKKLREREFSFSLFWKSLFDNVISTIMCALAQFRKFLFLGNWN